MAKVLHDSGKYRIEKWLFVTPRKMSVDVISKLSKAAQERGFDGNYVEATFLSIQLYSYPNILKEFPSLEVIDMGARMQKLEETLSRTHKLPASDKSLKQEDKTKPASADLKKAQAIAEADRTASNKKTIKELYYKTTDKAARLQCILILLGWYNPTKEKISDHLEYCEDGIRIARDINSYRKLAVVLAYKGSRLLELFAEEDSRAAYTIKMGNAIGFQFITEEERKKIIVRLNKLDEAAQASFAEAEELARRIGTPDVLGQVYISIGNAAGLVYIHLNSLGVDNRAAYEKALSKRALLLAKDIYASAGDELEVGYSLHNLANQLRFFGETDEAKSLAKEAEAIGIKHGKTDLVQTTRALLKRLETGRIPDYVHGESFGDEPA